MKLTNIYKFLSYNNNMTLEQTFKRWLKEGFEKLFELDKLKFNEVIIKKEIIESIMHLARENHPKEFLAFFQGAIKNKKLIINQLDYHQYYASESSAFPILQYGKMDFYGSVHSHPSLSNRPSKADMEFFRKTGIVHAIICRPFNFENIKFYNHHGEEIIVKIE